MNSETLLIHKPFLSQMGEFELANRKGYVKGKKKMEVPEDGSAEPMWDYYKTMQEQWVKLTGPRQLGSVQIIPVRGCLTYDDPYAMYFGASTVVMLDEYLEDAGNDDNTSHIILDIQSPGGSSYGIDSLAAKIQKIGLVKPVLGYTETIAASAAMWLYAACTKRFYGSQMAQIGSIGVYAAFFNYTKMLEKNGVEVDEYIAGEYKAAGSPYHNNSKAEKAAIQEQVDDLYTVFVNEMATLLGKSVEDVKQFADGRTYTGAKAQALGLSDVFLTMEGVIEMATNNDGKTPASGDGATAAQVAELNTKLETTNAQLAAAKTTLETQGKALGEATALLAAFKAKEDAAATIALAAKTTEDGKALYKTALKRDATEAELKAYAEMEPTARTAFSAALTSFSGAVAPNVAKLGVLGKEQAIAGEDKGTKSLLASAFQVIDGGRSAAQK